MALPIIWWLLLNSIQGDELLEDDLHSNVLGRISNRINLDYYEVKKREFCRVGESCILMVFNGIALNIK